MVLLSLSLLGPFQATLAGRPGTGFASSRVRALLAYPAYETAQPHQRQALAGLLWPEHDDQAALCNPRRALADLRTAIGDHEASPLCLLVGRDSPRFNVASDHRPDVAGAAAPLGKFARRGFPRPKEAQHALQSLLR